MFPSKNMMEAGGAVKVELLRIQGLARSNNVWVGGLVLEKSNAFKFFAANQDVGHAGKLFACSLGQVRAVDNPVVIHTAVETVLLAQAVGDHLSRCILFAWYRAGFSSN
jgi:hypothetical protein